MTRLTGLQRRRDVTNAVLQAAYRRNPASANRAPARAARLVAICMDAWMLGGLDMVRQFGCIAKVRIRLRAVSPVRLMQINDRTSNTECAVYRRPPGMFAGRGHLQAQPGSTHSKRAIAGRRLVHLSVPAIPRSGTSPPHSCRGKAPAYPWGRPPPLRSQVWRRHQRRSPAPAAVGMQRTVPLASSRRR